MQTFELTCERGRPEWEASTPLVIPCTMARIIQTLNPALRIHKAMLLDHPHRIRLADLHSLPLRTLEEEISATPSAVNNIKSRNNSLSPHRSDPSHHLR